jgi:hypothetical protein
MPAACGCGLAHVGGVGATNVALRGGSRSSSHHLASQQGAFKECLLL